MSKFVDFDPQNPTFCLLSLKDFGGQNPRILGAILAENDDIKNLAGLDSDHDIDN